MREEDELLIVSAHGVVVRLKAGEISQQGRMATGVRLQNLDDNDHIASISKIVAVEDQEKAAQKDVADIDPAAAAKASAEKPSDDEAKDGDEE